MRNVVMPASSETGITMHDDERDAGSHSLVRQGAGDASL